MVAAMPGLVSYTGNAQDCVVPNTFTLEPEQATWTSFNDNQDYLQYVEDGDPSGNYYELYTGKVMEYEKNLYLNVLNLQTTRPVDIYIAVDDDIVPPEELCDGQLRLDPSTLEIVAGFRYDPLIVRKLKTTPLGIPSLPESNFKITVTVTLQESEDNFVYLQAYVLAPGGTDLKQAVVSDVLTLQTKSESGYGP